MNAQDYELAKSKLEAKHKADLLADLESLDRIYRIIKSEANGTISISNGVSHHELKTPPPPKNAGVGKGMVMRGVIDIFDKSPDHGFTAAELTERLVAQGINTAKTSVNGAVGKLLERGFLEITVQGAGRRAGVFKKKT